MMSGRGTTPWYKEKFPRHRYLHKGDPLWIVEDDLQTLKDWVPLTKEEIDLWDDAKSVVIQKNKKREFLVDPIKDEDTKPMKKPDGNFRMEIEVLHIDHRGFIFSAEGKTATELEKRFWPSVDKLIAIFLSPKLLDSKFSKISIDFEKK